jgi:hypothetical protein
MSELIAMSTTRLILRASEPLGTIGWSPRPWTAERFPSLRALRRAYPGIEVDTL